MVGVRGWRCVGLPFAGLGSPAADLQQGTRGQAEEESGQQGGSQQSCQSHSQSGDNQFHVDLFQIAEHDDRQGGEYESEKSPFYFSHWLGWFRGVNERMWVPGRLTRC